MAENNNLPEEIHFTHGKYVERDKLPLLSSLVYGETHTSEMLNAKELGLKNPGIYTGFKVVANGGHRILVIRDAVRGYGSAMITLGLQNITILQQHDIELEVPNGAKWLVVLEAFYQNGVPTRQVSANSDIDSATIRLVEEGDLVDDHLILAEIDLLSNPSSITESDISEVRRIERIFSVDDHVAAIDPHPQYTSDDEARIIADDAIEAVLTDDHLGNDSSKIVSQKALNVGLSEKVNVSDISVDHTEVSATKVSSAKAVSRGLSEKIDITKIKDDYVSPTSYDVASTQAVADAVTEAIAHTNAEITRIMGDTPQETLDSFTEVSQKFNDTNDAFASVMMELETKIAKTSISQSYSASAIDTVPSSKTLKDGLASKADINHAHDADDLPEATTTAKGVVQLTDSYGSNSSLLAATAKALADGLGTKLSNSLRSNSYNSQSTSTIATSKALYDLYQIVLGRLTQTAADARYILKSTLSTGKDANSVAKRDGSGDLHARLFRTDHPDTNNIGGGMVFRTSITDNYLRVCSNIVAIRNWLSVYSKAESNKLYADAYNETTGNITLTRKSRRQILMRVGSGNGTVTIDAPTYQAGDVIDIYNSRDGSGIATIHNSDGQIYTDSGAGGQTHTFTDKGRLRLIKRASGNHFEAFSS